MKTSTHFKKNLLAGLIGASIMSLAVAPSFVMAASSDANLRGHAPPNALVTARNVATGSTRVTKANGEGSYALVGLVRTQPARALPLPDAQLMLAAAPMTAGPHFGPFLKPYVDAFAIKGVFLTPESRGHASLASADPARPAVIRQNFLATENDRRSVREMVRRMRDIGAQAPLQRFIAEELAPGVAATSDADIDMQLGLEVFPVDGRVGARYGFSRTTVSFGTASAILSGGCSAAVAKALEAACDGFFDGFIGPAIAGQLRNEVQAGMSTAVTEFNRGRSPPYKVHDFALTDFNLLVRLCPVSAPPAPSDHGRPGGGGVGPANG